MPLWRRRLLPQCKIDIFDEESNEWHIGTVIEREWIGLSQTRRRAPKKTLKVFRDGVSLRILIQYDSINKKEWIEYTNDNNPENNNKIKALNTMTPFHMYLTNYKNNTTPNDVNHSICKSTTSYYCMTCNTECCIDCCFEEVNDTCLFCDLFRDIKMNNEICYFDGSSWMICIAVRVYRNITKLTLVLHCNGEIDKVQIPVMYSNGDTLLTLKVKPVPVNYPKLPEKQMCYSKKCNECNKYYCIYCASSPAYRGKKCKYFLCYLCEMKILLENVKIGDKFDMWRWCEAEIVTVYNIKYIDNQSNKLCLRTDYEHGYGSKEFEVSFDECILSNLRPLNLFTPYHAYLRDPLYKTCAECSSQWRRKWCDICERSCCSKCALVNVGHGKFKNCIDCVLNEEYCQKLSLITIWMNKELIGYVAGFEKNILGLICNYSIGVFTKCRWNGCSNIVQFRHQFEYKFNAEAKLCEGYHSVVW